MPVTNPPSTTATAADLAASKHAPAVDETVPANTSVVVNRSYTVPLGKKLTISSGARFRIL